MMSLLRTATLHFCAVLLMPAYAFAHAIAPGDKGYIMCTDGVRLGPFLYLGAKHMVTGLDHILFLLAVIFFLYRFREIGLYVTLFAVGHSATLLLGVLGGIQVNPYAIDGIIGLSVVYKALDNLSFFESRLGFRPNTKIATLVFGLFHGMGLATKVLDFEVSRNGLVQNLIAFNVGVELGQIFALSVLLIGLSWWRATPSFARRARLTNLALVAAGFLLVAYQLLAFLTSEPSA